MCIITVYYTLQHVSTFDFVFLLFSPYIGQCLHLGVIIPVVTAAHDRRSGTTHHHRTHGRTDEGTSKKIELTDGSTEVSSVILVSPEDDQCCSKHLV
jgi:hypothetical protein